MLRACYVAEVVSWLASLPSLFDLFHYSSLPGKSLELRRIALVLHNRIQEGNNFGKSEQGKVWLFIFFTGSLLLLYFCPKYYVHS